MMMRTADLVGEFMLDCEYRQLSPKTITNYQWAAAKLQAAHSEMPQTGHDMRLMLADPRLGLESRRTLARMLNRIFNWGVKNRLVELNPLKELDPLPRRKLLPRVLDELELERLLHAATTRRDRALLCLPLDNGLRLGEIASLTWPSVRADHVRVQGKTGERQVPISADLRRMLIGLGDEHHVWTGRKGPLTREGIKTTYQRLFRRSRLTGRKLGPHTLRHTFATLYVRDGGNVRVLQEILGHSDLETTMIYVNLAGRDVSADHARHSPLKHIYTGGDS